jgi:hypothetical protein
MPLGTFIKIKGYLCITIASPVVRHIGSAGANARALLAPISSISSRWKLTDSPSSLLARSIADSNRIWLSIISSHLYMAIVRWRHVSHWLLKAFNHFREICRYLKIFFLKTAVNEENFDRRTNMRQLVFTWFNSSGAAISDVFVLI